MSDVDAFNVRLWCIQNARHLSIIQGSTRHLNVPSRTIQLLGHRRVLVIIDVRWAHKLNGVHVTNPVPYHLAENELFNHDNREPIERSRRTRHHRIRIPLSSEAHHLVHPPNAPISWNREFHYIKDRLLSVQLLIPCSLALLCYATPPHT